MRLAIVMIRTILLLAAVAGACLYLAYRTQEFTHGSLPVLTRTAPPKELPKNERPQVASAIQQVLFHIYRAQIAYIVQEDSKKRSALKDTISQEKLHYTENSSQLQKFATEQDKKMRAAIDQSAQDFFELADKAMDQADANETESAWNIADNLSESAFNEALDNLEQFSRFAPQEPASQSSADVTAFENGLNQTLLQQGAIAAATAGILILLLSSFGLTSRKTGKLVAASEKLARGEQTEIPLTHRHDALGELARNLSLLQNHLKERDRLQETLDSTRAELTQLQEQATTLLQNKLKTMTGSVIQEAEELYNDTASITQRTEQALQRTSSLSSDTARVVYLAKGAADSTDTFSSSLTEVTQQAHKTSQLTRQATEYTTRTRDTLSLLNRHLEGAGALVETLSAIGNQTGLLTLNASIETSRLGAEAGELNNTHLEIKTLAQETLAVSGRITSLLESMQATVSEADTMLETLAGSSEELEEIAIAITASLKHQSSATQDISRGVLETADENEKLGTDLQQIEEGFGETIDASRAVMDSLRNLADKARQLDIQADEYLQKVKAA